MRIGLWCGLIIGIVTLTVTSANAQFRMRSDFRDPVRITPEIERGVQQAMLDAEEAIKLEQFVPAVIHLQSILDHSEDFFLQKDFRTKAGPFRSVKERACRILADWPDKALSTYELNYGATARTMLNDAIQRSDREQFAEVVRRFEMTTAGYEALRILTEAAFDRGRPLEAALLCEALMNHPLAGKQAAGPMMLRTAFAWYLTGNPERSAAALNSLKDFDSFSSWRIGAKTVPPFRDGDIALNWLNANFGPLSKPTIRVVDEWTLPRGGASNSESATVAFPISPQAWSVSPFENIRLKFDQSNLDWKNELIARTDQIVKTYRDRNQLIQPVAAPVVADGVVAFRTPNDITAVDVETGQLRWRSSMTDGVLALLAQLTQNRSIGSVSAGSYIGLTLTEHLESKQFRDRLSGTLTSDGVLLYAIEESGAIYNSPRPQIRGRTGDFQFSVPTNKLVAYDLSSGRIAWEAGGTRGTEPVELSGTFFLGPPVPYEGRLYCLAEMKDELCLVCMTSDGRSPRLEWSQSLVAINRSMSVATLRRQSGLMPALQDGMAICPTSSGSVVAFDLVHQQLKWGYAYEVQRFFYPSDGFGVIPTTHSDDDEPRWADGNPLFIDSKIILTPLDSAELHCISAIDGTVFWKKPRRTGAYVACVSDRAVIVVGRTQVVAHSLTDGAEWWAQPIEIPAPSGRGVRIDSRYLLPLSNGEIATIDLTKGQIIARSTMPDGRVPGNLSISKGRLVSSSPHDVVAFRPLAEIEQRIAMLSTRPDDPEALAMRGELRLHEGQIESAIADLRESLQRRSNPNVQRVLAATLLNASIDHPDRLLSAASELQTLIIDPGQRIEFLRAYVRSLIGTGNRTEAIKQLFRIAETPMKTDELISVESGYSISLWQSIRSQLLTTFETCPTDDQLQAVGIFENEFKNALTGDDGDQKLTRLLDLVLDHPAASSSLKRLLTSNKLMADDSVRQKYLERLTQSRDNSVAALATGRLAKELIDAESITSALPWIVRLGHDFSSDIGLDDQTGRQLYDKWMERDDVRAAGKPVAVWPVRTIEAKKTREPLARLSFPISAVTHVGNHFEGWSFEIDTNNGVFTARDPSLHVAWRFQRVGLVDVSRTPAIQLHIRGRNIVLSCGAYLVSLECSESTSDPKLLFERSLRTTPSIERRQFEMRSRRPQLANGRRIPSDSDGFLIGLSDEAVIYQMENRLLAADIESGQVLWSRTGTVFSRSGGTVDRLLVLYSTNHDAFLLRPLDGALLQQHKGNPDEHLIWFPGTRRLSQRNEGTTRRIFEMRDIDGDKVVWQSQHPQGTLASVINREELALLEPAGQLIVMDLATGKPLLTVETPAVRPHGTDGTLAVQRNNDRYVIFAGGPTSTQTPPPITIQKMGLSNDENTVVDGFACAIDRTEARVVWSVPVKQMAYETSQPANIPVMVLGSRQNGFEHPGEQRVSVLILNKQDGKIVFDEPPTWNKVRDTFIGGGRGVQYDPQIDQEKLIVDFQDWNVVLEFPTEAKPSN